jgi:hypothetical protein
VVWLDGEVSVVGSKVVLRKSYRNVRSKTAQDLSEIVC